MKVNLDAVLTDLEGQPIRDPIPARDEAGNILKDKDSKPIMVPGPEVTLGILCVRALMAAEERDQTPGEEKLRRYDLARRLLKAGEQSIEAKDVTLLKDRIGKFFTTLVVGQAYHMLEGDE